MKRTLLLLFTCLMLLSWPQRAMAELHTAVFALSLIHISEPTRRS